MEHRRKKRELTALQIHSRGGGGGGGEWDGVVGVLCQECRLMLKLEVLKGLVLSPRSTGTVQTPLWQTARRRRRHAQPLSYYQCAFLCLGAFVFTHVSKQEAAPPAPTSSRASRGPWLIFPACLHSFFAEVLLNGPKGVFLACSSSAAHHRKQNSAFLG